MAELFLWTCWLTCLGGAVGSFLNVVVYRLPRRESLITPPSHCPRCGHPIRWFDNLPVFGWIVLGGRCRDCRAAISIRYPLIEAVVAATFGISGWFVLGQYGARGIPLLIAILVAASTLLAVALILADVRRNNKNK